MNVAIRSESIAAARALCGRVSLVTGSTSGIGLGIARALAAAGSEIVLNGFGTPESIAEAQAQIASEFNVRVLHSPAYMSKPASIRQMVELTLASFGRLDLLVNNAGIQHVAPLQEFPPEKWDAILAINLSSAFHTSRFALPSMLDHKWGRIINIASAHGLVGSTFKSAYVAAKHGMLGLTKVIALETAEHGITCNAICPGYVYTPLVETQIDKKCTVTRARRSFGMCSSPSNRTSVLPLSKNSARSPSSWQATRPLRSPVLLCRLMEDGPPTDRSDGQLYADNGTLRARHLRHYRRVTCPFRQSGTQ